MSQVTRIARCKGLNPGKYAQLEEQASKPTIKELFERIDRERSGGRMSLAHAAELVRADRDSR